MIMDCVGLYSLVLAQSRFNNAFILYASKRPFLGISARQKDRILKFQPNLEIFFHKYSIFSNFVQCDLLQTIYKTFQFAFHK